MQRVLDTEPVASVEDYAEAGGGEGLRRALGMTPEEVRSDPDVIDAYLGVKHD
jgi:hypothetical protein